MALITNRHDASKLDTEELAKVAEDILFQPSPLMQTMKAQFWARFQPGPVNDTANLTLPTVQQYVSDPRLKKYWSTPGFKEWFTNQDENRERIEYLWMVGLDTAEQILRDSNAQPNAKVQLLKLLAEVAGKLPKPGKNDEKFADASINNMDAKELKAWLKRRGITSPEILSERESTAPTTPDA